MSLSGNSFLKEIFLIFDVRKKKNVMLIYTETLATLKKHIII